MKSYSTSPIIREIQIKTTVRYQITLVRIVIIKTFTKNKCWRGCGEKGHPRPCQHTHCSYECKFDAAAMEFSMEVP